MGLLEGKTALITGAARGIGKAIALKFAAEGANIAFTDLEVNLETEKEIAALGVKAKSYASNAADFAQTEEVVKAVKEEFGAIDILVNNAGITKDGLMLRMTEQQWDAVIAVNAHHAGHVDNRATSLAHHNGHAGVDEVESRFQVHCNHCIPLLFGHTEHQSVLGDAGIVHQNVNRAKLLLHGFHHLLSLCKVGSVAGVALSLHALGCNLLFGFLVNCQVGESHVGSLLGKLQCDSFSDTACRAGYQCGLTL